MRPVGSESALSISEAGGAALAADDLLPSGLLPSNLLQLPASTDTALVVELESNRLFVFDNDGPPPIRSSEYFVDIGKSGGDKRREGDEKTPVGIYFPSSFLPAKTLPAIYGAGAFPINYPNTWDRRLGRTGSGIWIHGTDKDEESLTPQSSRGCLARRAAARIGALRRRAPATVEDWRQDWESRDTEAYLEHYSPSFRSEGMSRERWVAHKRRVNAAKTFIRVILDEVGIYGYPDEEDLVLVTFRQEYRSNNFKRTGWKLQYWRLEEGAWRIVHEGGF